MRLSISVIEIISGYIGTVFELRPWVPEDMLVFKKLAKNENAIDYLVERKKLARCSKSDISMNPGAVFQLSNTYKFMINYDSILHNKSQLVNEFIEKNKSLILAKANYFDGAVKMRPNLEKIFYGQYPELNSLNISHFLSNEYLYAEMRTKINAFIMEEIDISNPYNARILNMYCDLYILEKIPIENITITKNPNTFEILKRHNREFTNIELAENEHPEAMKILLERVKINYNKKPIIRMEVYEKLALNPQSSEIFEFICPRKQLSKRTWINLSSNKCIFTENTNIVSIIDKAIHEKKQEKIKTLLPWFPLDQLRDPIEKPNTKQLLLDAVKFDKPKYWKQVAFYETDINVITQYYEKFKKCDLSANPIAFNMLIDENYKFVAFNSLARNNHPIAITLIEKYVLKSIYSISYGVSKLSTKFLESLATNSEAIHILKSIIEICDNLTDLFWINLSSNPGIYY